MGQISPSVGFTEWLTATTSRLLVTHFTAISHRMWFLPFQCWTSTCAAPHKVQTHNLRCTEHYLSCLVFSAQLKTHKTSADSFTALRRDNILQRNADIEMTDQSAEWSLFGLVCLCRGNRPSRLGMSGFSCNSASSRWFLKVRIHLFVLGFVLLATEEKTRRTGEPPFVWLVFEPPDRRALLFALLFYCRLLFCFFSFWKTLVKISATWIYKWYATLFFTLFNCCPQTTWNTFCITHLF